MRINVIDRLYTSLERSVEYALPNMTLIGTMGVIGFPLFYFVWAYWAPQPYESLFLRLAGSLLLLPVALHAYWPTKFRKHLPVYWCLAIAYGPCFFFIFMLFQNDLNQTWTLSAMAGAVLLVFLSYDIFMILTLYLAGLVSAVAASYAIGSPVTAAHWILYVEQLPIYLFVFFFGAAFNHSKERILREKHKTALGIGGTMAHEIRTPLISVRSAAEGLKQHLPTLIQAYDFANENKAVPRIHPLQYRHLAKMPDSVIREIDYANTIIDMLLFNANNNYLDTNTFQKLSITQCVNDTIANYPFKGDEERNKITCQLNDFYFIGNAGYIRNVLFNLINNALYFIAETKKGNITITTTAEGKYNCLHFKDTSKGIKPNDLANIFLPFYSKGKNGGTGIGLSFCKQVMRAFKGDITCRSVYGEYTEFILSFPPLRASSL